MLLLYVYKTPSVIDMLGQFSIALPAGLTVSFHHVSIFTTRLLCVGAGGGDQGKKYAPAGENLSVRSLQLFTFFRARTGGGKFTHHFRPPSLSRFEFPSAPPAAKICE